MVKVLESCVRTLQSMELRTCCFLTGFESESGDQILSLVKASDCWPEGSATPKLKWEEELEMVSSLLPGGVRAYGLAVKAETQDVTADLFRELDKAGKLLGDHPLLVVAQADDVIFYRDQKPLQVDMFNGSPAELASEHVLLRCNMPLYLQIFYDKNGGDQAAAAAVRAKSDELSTAMAQGLYFRLPNSGKSSGRVVKAGSGEKEAVAVACNAPQNAAAQTMAALQAGSGGKDSKKKKKKDAFMDDWDAEPSAAKTKEDGDGEEGDGSHKSSAPAVFDTEAGQVVQVEALVPAALDATAATPPAPALLTFSPSNLHVAYCPVTVDALVYCKRTAGLGGALGLLASAVESQLQSLLALLGSSQTKLASGTTYRTCAYHFLPPRPVPAYLVPVCHCLPSEHGAAEDAADEVARRKQLHEKYMLPFNWPMLRVCSSFPLVPGGKSASDDRIRNIHAVLGAPESGVAGGTRHMVKGDYLYYHYMQDKFSDKGWGCAYRSLQTLCSWFLLNHFTDKPVPTFEEIQKCLVKIGDKGRSFIGSNQWIGSTEVGFIIDEMLGVTWRNMNTPTGPDLAGKGRELARHFDTHGTPIMMGGGLLAFTLLGIDFNASTGEIAFLILDPHYCGADDAKTILHKEIKLEGYTDRPCGWRRADTFDKTSFYNLCMPECPDRL